MAGLIEKSAHFQIGNQFVLVLISAWARIDPSPLRAFLLQMIWLWLYSGIASHKLSIIKSVSGVTYEKIGLRTEC
jgi:hypothetical protein